MILKQISSKRKFHQKPLFYTKNFFFSNLKDYTQHRDHLISGHFNDGSARFVFSDISRILTDCCKRFNLYEYDKLNILSIAYNTTILMNSFLSGEERVKLTSQYSQNIDAESKLKVTSVYSESICTGEVRGFIEDSFIDEADFEGEINQFLKISKIFYGVKSEVSGIIRLTDKILTEYDIFRYFEESEQIKTFVKLNLNYIEKDDKLLSHGFILQKMPDCNEPVLEKVFNQIVKSVKFESIINNNLTVNKLQDLFRDLSIDVTLNSRTPIDFFCRCSLETFKSVLKTLPINEIIDMKEKKQNSLKCKACNTEYCLSDKDFEDIIHRNKT